MQISKKERTQKEIMEAAKEIIHEKGYEAVTVRCLAEATVIPIPIFTIISKI